MPQRTKTTYFKGIKNNACFAGYIEDDVVKVYSWPSLSSLAVFDVNSGVREDSSIGGADANVLSIIQSKFSNVVSQENIASPVEIGEQIEEWSLYEMI